MTETIQLSDSQYDRLQEFKDTVGFSGASDCQTVALALKLAGRNRGIELTE